MNPVQEQIKSGKEILNVHLWQAANPKTTLISLHGAGTSDKTRFEYQAPHLLEHGISVITFDFSGHGESSGNLEDSSLEKRVHEARAVIDAFADTKNLALCGSSMGGHIVLKLLETYSPHALILFAPAVYTREAYAITFNAGFTETIRTPESWQDSDAWPLLEKFTGKLLTVIGDHDEVIPRELMDRIHASARYVAKNERLIIPAAPHAIHKFLQTHPRKNEAVEEKMIEVL